MGYDNGEETINKLMQRTTTKTEHQQQWTTTHNKYEVSMEF